MPLPARAAEWMSRADVDYIGPFVKAWAAFNAWYRQASGETQERLMLEFVKTQPNPLRRNILPLLANDIELAEAVRLKQGIYDLQQSLDAIHLEITRRGVNERISLRSVCIRPRQLQREPMTKNRFKYAALKQQGGTIDITVTSVRDGGVRFRHRQLLYDPEEVYSKREFNSNLSNAQQNSLREFYDGCNPRPMYDLVQGTGPPLSIVTMQFRCTPSDLLAGLIETIYAMRNALLHGEVEPDLEVLACYEPAYRIVMQFLGAIR